MTNLIHRIAWALALSAAVVGCTSDDNAPDEARDEVGVVPASVAEEAHADVVEPMYPCPPGKQCCGNGRCDGRETCLTCRPDCGQCPIEP